MANAYKDGNHVSTLIAASSSDGQTPVRLYADPATHRLLVDLPGGTGTVSSVSSADANATVANPTTTPAITIVSAPKLQTARTIGGTSFDGTANIQIGALNSTNIAATTSAQLAGVISDETGSGALVFATSPTLVTPALGTPSSGVATNLTGTASGLTAGTVTTNANLTGAVTSVGNATSLGSFTSANLASALTDETGSGANVFATSPVLVTPALGTPSSGVGTNITGIPAANILAGTFGSGAYSFGTGNAVTLGTVELGAASDTTLSRSSAGILAVEGVVIPSVSSANTLSNKRMAWRVVTTAQSATPTVNTDNTDVAYITGLAQAVTSFTTNLSGTPSNGDILVYDITDNGTARGLTWGTSFESSTVALPTTTVISTKITVAFRWNIATNKWTCVSVS